MSLAQALDAAPDIKCGRTCGLCAVLDQLPPDERAVLNTHLTVGAARYKKSQSQVARIIKDELGQHVAPGAIGRHRRGECWGTR